MFTSASLVYTVPQGGASSASLAAAVAAVPISTDILDFLGLRVTSDATVAGPPVVRTVHVSLDSATAATATASTLGSQPTGSPVEAVTVVAGGTGYVAPPGVQFSDSLGTGEGAAAKAFLAVEAVTRTPGSGYGPVTFAVAYGGLPPGNGSAGQTSFHFQEVLRATVTAGGVGYSPKTTVTFVGGLSPRGKSAEGFVQLSGGVITGIEIFLEGDEYLVAPRVVITDPTGSGSGASASVTMVLGKTVYFQGRPALFALTLSGGGAITGVAISDPGDGYIAPPEIVIVDPSFAGSGGSLVPSMEVQKIVVTSGGGGYQRPVVTLVPRFRLLFPDDGDQRAPLFNLLTVAISRATRTQVVASTPVMS